MVPGSSWNHCFGASRNAVFIRSHDAVIRIYDDAGNVIETYKHAGEFKEW